jgi:hypothetical protein
MKMATLHTRSRTYKQLAIFMLRGAPEAHDACRKQAIALIENWKSGSMSAMDSSPVDVTEF